MSLATSSSMAGGAAVVPRSATATTASAFVTMKRRATAVRAVHAAEPSKNPPVGVPSAAKTSSPSVAAPEKAPVAAAPAPVAPAPAATKQVAPARWAVDSWRTKKALQLPEYPNAAELEAVLKTIEAFPPIVFAGEARHLEERLADAAMGRAFLLQGGDCAESFKEFNGNNIRDTFRVLLQMSAVLTFGGQMPVIKVVLVHPIRKFPKQNPITHSLNSFFYDSIRFVCV
jgi:3-deoxy-7-phosphoheptulonate synthase